MPLYAAYGLNLDPARMLERCPLSPLAGSGWVTGWRLTFGGDPAVATVVEATGAQVFVGLYDVSPLDEPTLDAWEKAETGMEQKLKVRVQTLEGSQLAWWYVLPSYEGGLPTPQYLNLLAEAAEAGGAPNDYVTELRSRPTA
ncbi:gamma-glutamylcyclotransferase family protein [Fodinicola acaciae]|uniref:gamma-glutamylcyclotransferase family protein n=1 Tax=Fodinicola acaciae TaxID=2681555 RepID=UPI0013D49681|nr:gamma-glutamylcyclotransferase family protein [Fodinicola acaciae]